MIFTEQKKAVVLLSGGIDSSTTLVVAKSKGCELYALSFDYNQRHKRELESAKMVAESFGVKKHLTIKFDLREIGGSALTSDIEVPSTFNLHPSSFIPVTYVPARNTIFLSFAIAWAEVLEATDIFVGANAIDYSGYPDCRPEYLRAFEDMANLATKASIEGRLRFMIKSPLVSMKKSEIIKKGIELGLDYSLTWSCYDPQKLQNTEYRTQNTVTPPPRPLPQGEGESLKISSPSRGEGKGGGESLGSGLWALGSEIYIPCGRCDSCVFRAKGFKEAGIKDPLINE